MTTPVSVTVTTAGVSTVLKQIQKPIAFITVTNQTVIKAITKTTFAAVTIGVAAVLEAKVKLLTIAVTTIGVALSSNQTGKIAATTTTGVMTLLRAISKPISVITATVQVIVKFFNFGNTFAAMTTGVATSSQLFIPAPSGTSAAGGAGMYKGPIGGPGKTVGQ